MGRPLRIEQFQSQDVGIVHVVQRCVRRAFLAGVDPQSGKDYSFRKDLIRRRTEALASVFGVDVLAYAVMSNHVHLVLRNRPDVVAAWSDRDVAIRWLRVFPGRRLEEYLAEPTENDVNALVNQPERLMLIRHRLSDISWFMRALSEPIARLSNRQDECTGRFWEGRFKAMRVVDEAGLLACAMYVDLNPVRAAMVERPEDFIHTSVYDRLQGEKGQKIHSAAFDLVPVKTEEAGKAICNTPIVELKQRLKAKKRNPTGRRIRRDDWLAPLTLDKSILADEPQVHRDGYRASNRGFLQLCWQDYWELLRWTAAQAINGAMAKIPARLTTMLASMGVDSSMWRDLVWNFNKYYGRGSCIGSAQSLSEDAQRHGRRWHRGQRLVKSCFASG